MTTAITVQPIIQNQNYINSIEMTSKKYNVFIDSDISDPSDYRELLTILFNSSNMDVIYLYINCFGGNLDTTLSLVEGIKMSNAKVTAVLMGPCHSAASIISLNCDEIVVLDNAYAMIHTASMGYSGNVGNIKSHTDFAVNQIEKLIVSTYKGFLTDEELDKVKSGSELWFNAKELRKRLKNKFKYIKKNAKNV